MSDPTKPKDKAEEEPRDNKRCLSIGKFKAMLRKVVKSPPMAKRLEVQSSDAEA